MDKWVFKGRNVARSLEEQLAWEGGNTCYGLPSRAVSDYLLWREGIIQEKAQQQQAAALDTYSPLPESPATPKDSSSAGKSEPVRGVACMMGSSPYAHYVGKNMCMPNGLAMAAHGCRHAPGVRAAYVL